MCNTTTHAYWNSNQKTIGRPLSYKTSIENKNKKIKFNTLRNIQNGIFMTSVLRVCFPFNRRVPRRDFKRSGDLNAQRQRNNEKSEREALTAVGCEKNNSDGKECYVSQKISNNNLKKERKKPITNQRRRRGAQKVKSSERAVTPGDGRAARI